MRDLLHALPPTDIKSNEECQSFSDLVAAFFINKVRDIRSRISIVLNGAASNPMTFYPQHIEIMLSNMTPVTVDEVKDILTSMFGKSSPLDFMTHITVEIVIADFCTNYFSTGKSFVSARRFL